MDNKVIAKVISQLNTQASKLTAAINTIPLEMKDRVVKTSQDLASLREKSSAHTIDVNVALGAVTAITKKEYTTDPATPNPGSPDTSIKMGSQ